MGTTAAPGPAVFTEMIFVQNEVRKGTVFMVFIQYKWCQWTWTWCARCCHPNYPPNSLLRSTHENSAPQWQARSRKERAKEALRISELEMSLVRWQQRLQQMESRLAGCERFEVRTPRPVSEALCDRCRIRSPCHDTRRDSRHGRTRSMSLPAACWLMAAMRLAASGGALPAPTRSTRHQWGRRWVSDRHRSRRCW